MPNKTEKNFEDLVREALSNNQTMTSDKGREKLCPEPTTVEELGLFGNKQSSGLVINVPSMKAPTVINVNIDMRKQIYVDNRVQKQSDSRVALGLGDSALEAVGKIVGRLFE